MVISQTKLRERYEKKELERPTVAPQMVQEATAQIESLHLRENDQIVLDALMRISNATRSDLVKLCDLPRTTIYDALIRLIRFGVVERYFEERTKRGRPRTFYRVLIAP